MEGVGSEDKRESSFTERQFAEYWGRADWRCWQSFKEINFGGNRLKHQENSNYLELRAERLEERRDGVKILLFSFFKKIQD